VSYRVRERKNFFLYSKKTKETPQRKPIKKGEKGINKREMKMIPDTKNKVRARIERKVEFLLYDIHKNAIP
jgi:hypothetical protein